MMNYRIVALKQGITTAYLIQGNGPWVQIDTGYEHDYDKYVRLLKSKRIDPSSIQFLILTHHHDDHVGYLNKLVRDNVGVKILLNEETATLLRKGENNKANGGGLLNRRVFGLYRLRKLLTPSWDMTFPPYNVRNDDIVIEKREWPIPDAWGIPGVVVCTPGHTSDSMSLLTDSGDLFCGDLTSNILKLAGTRHTTLFNENMEDVYESWRVLLKKGARKIYPAHGKPFDADRLRANLDLFKTQNLVRF